MNEHQMIKEVRSGKIFPVYLLFGPEELLAEDTLKEAVNILIDPSSKDFNFNSYNAEDRSVTEILDTVRTLPFMADRRVVIVKRVDNAKKQLVENKNLLDYLQSPYKETCLIFTAAEIDKRRKFYNFISKTGKVFYFPKLKSNQTVNWIQKKIKFKERQIESSAANYLADVFDNNLKRIETELEKIILYCGENKFIDLNTTQFVAGNPKVESIFALTDSIGKKSVEGSLGKMDNLFAHGSPPLQTLGMISRQFRLIWQAKALFEKGTSSAQISRKIGVHPFFVNDIISQAKKFTGDNLKYVFERLLQADLELKSTGRSPNLIMESLVIDLCLI